tara:strand:+ start:573 stop:761 length:189 start_codon:yes stop_codon:yes gene_type:complete
MKYDSNRTGRYPRTMEEAFGPYASGGITEKVTPMDKWDRIILSVCLIILTAFIAMVLLGWVD